MSPAALVCLQRDRLTLALVREDTTDDDASLLTAAHVVLKETELALADAESAPALSEHRHLVLSTLTSASHARGWPSREETWSGAGKESDTSAALWDARRGLEDSPRVHETFIRTATSQWAVVSRDVTAADDITLVLPKRFGRDGSLIDAAHQLDAIKRAMQAIRR